MSTENFLFASTLVIRLANERIKVIIMNIQNSMFEMQQRTSSRPHLLTFFHIILEMNLEALRPNLQRPCRGGGRGGGGGPCPARHESPMKAEERYDYLCH